MSEISQILEELEPDDQQAASRLLPLVYEELRKIAAIHLQQEKPGQTLDPTGLVHEAYLRLISGHARRNWISQRYFFAAASEAMRRILIDRARSKKGEKHGGGKTRIDWQSVDLPAKDELEPEAMIDLDQAIEQLTREFPAKGELVRLRFFAGLSLIDAAQCLGISKATADRHWAFARAWLFERLSSGDFT